MITAELTDKLRRDLLIVPVSARFGTIKMGGEYELVINVKNEDVLAQRINVRPPRTKYVRVFMQQLGQV